MYHVTESDFERVRKAAQTMLDSDGAFLEFANNGTWEIDASQTLAIGCGMLAALEGLLSDKEAGAIASDVTRSFVELADIRARLDCKGQA